MKNIRILIGVPAYGSMMLTPFVTSLSTLSGTLIQNGIDHQIHILTNSLVQRSRNAFASVVLNSDFTHLLMADVDGEFTSQCVLDMISRDKPIVSAAFAGKLVDWDKVSLAAHTGTPSTTLAEVAAPLVAVRANTLHQQRGDLIPQPAVGSGLILIQRRVLESIRDRFGPELEYVEPEEADQAFYNFFGPLIVTDPDKKQKVLLGEDHSFSWRAAECGHQSYLLVSHRTVHHGLFPFVWNKQAHEQVATNLQAITQGQNNG